MTKPIQRRTIEIAFALCVSFVASGCGLLGGQTGQEDKSSAPGCDEQSTAIADDAGVVGATPDEVAATLRGPFTAPFTWTRQSTRTQITIELSYAGDAARRVTDSGCNVTLELPVTVAITTADGLLAERVQATLVATEREGGTLSVTIPLRELTGSYDATDVAVSDPSSTQVGIDIDLAGGATFGEVRLTPSMDEVGRWPAPQ